ncbi:MAG: type II toxin-antitoxin system Phd/YefM family antitoxin [Spirochaetales bacterium]|nr:type II toxin-antitoxin system Phd/YefM family antitoxin [Spirochaetales bacterium]
MYVSATEVQNNFGKYLKLCKVENIVITRNGKKQAMLLYYPRNSDGYEAGEPFPDYGTSPRKEGYVTYQQFLDMTENSDNRYELIDGEVFLLASPRFTHQRILGVLYIAFWEFLKGHDSCGPFMAPFDIDLVRQHIKLLREVNEDDINVVQPDVIVLCDYEKDINEKDKYKGTPTLVVEILSPSTRSKDRIKKLGLYMESGVEECWIVDPMNESIMIYFFKDCELDTDAVYMRGQQAKSVKFSGMTIDVDTVFG